MELDRTDRVIPPAVTLAEGSAAREPVDAVEEAAEGGGGSGACGLGRGGGSFAVRNEERECGLCAGEDEPMDRYELAFECDGGGVERPSPVGDTGERSELDRDGAGRAFGVLPAEMAVAVTGGFNTATKLGGGG